MAISKITGRCSSHLTLANLSFGYTLLLWRRPITLYPSLLAKSAAYLLVAVSVLFTLLRSAQHYDSLAYFASRRAIGAGIGAIIVTILRSTTTTSKAIIPSFVLTLIELRAKQSCGAEKIFLSCLDLVFFTIYRIN